MSHLPSSQQSLIALKSALKSDVLVASQLLLGWHIVWGDLEAQIVETEAYRTPDDPACHAFRGRTPRTEVLYGPPGRAYVYFTYGHHWMLNLVAHPVDIAAAILIRAAKPIQGQNTMFERRLNAQKESDLLSGPGKICQAFQISKPENGIELLEAPEGGLCLRPGPMVKNIIALPRVGIAPGRGDELPWRFIDEELAQWASPPRPKPSK